LAWAEFVKGLLSPYLITLLGLGRWGNAAADVVRCLGHAVPALQAGEAPAEVVEELGEVLGLLRELPDDAWRRVAAGLGPWRGWVTRQRDSKN
jgi:hypothetical protein